MEPCLKGERANMNTFRESFAFCFYIHLPVIYEMRVIIPFTSWNNQAFNVVEFSDRFFSFSKNFPSDYQLFSVMSPAQLSALLETQFVRCFLVEKTLRGKYSRTLGGLQSWVNNEKKSTREGGLVMKQLTGRWNALKALVEGVATQVCA